MKKILKFSLYLFLNDYIRDFSGSFWIFFFPLILYLILTSIFGGIADGENVTFRIGIVYEKKSTVFEKMVSHLKGEKAFDIREYRKVDEALKQLKESKLDVVIFVDKNFDSSFTKAILLARTKMKLTVPIDIYYVPERTESSMAKDVVRSILKTMEVEIWRSFGNFKDVKVESSVEEKTKKFNVAHYYFPSIVMVTIMSIGFFSIPYSIAGKRERKSTRRFLVSPFGSGEFIVSVILNNFLALLISLTLLFSMGMLLYRVPKVILSPQFILQIIFGMLIYSMIGLMIVSLAKRTSTISIISNSLFQAMMFLGNFYFNVLNMSWGIRWFVYINPATYILDKLRGTMGYNSYLSNHLLVPFAWLVFSILVVILNFKRVMEVE